MHPRLYDLCMLIGLVSVTAGAWALGGWPVAAVAGGVVLLAATVAGAALERAR